MSYSEPIEMRQKSTQKRNLKTSLLIIESLESRPNIQTIHEHNPVGKSLFVLVLDIRLEHVPALPVPLEHSLDTHVINIDVLGVQGDELAAALEHGDGVVVGGAES